MKIVTIVGARPQFIKAAVGSKQLRKHNKEILVHTGQHFDYNMSDVFFRELDIPEPNYNLGISGGTHAEMTAKMLVGIEKVLISENPDAVLVYGDTNSTLAGALASAKLNIPVFHIEAGNRLGTLNNPEEVNRITTDHLSSINFCATEKSFENLKREGLGNKSYNVGNIMYESFLYYSNFPWSNPRLYDLNGNKISLPTKYYYMTCHRQENTQDDFTLSEILKAMNSLDAPTIYSVHPRNHRMAIALCEKNAFDNIILIQPVGYIDSINLVQNAIKVVTDSGGLQCEAFYAKVQCVFVFEHIVWPETMVGARNQLACANCDDILKKLSIEQVVDLNYKPFGDGHTSEHICSIIENWNK